jgi:large subunit ribosomal protein L10
MPNVKKIEAVEALTQSLQRSPFTIATGFRGLRVQDLQELRRRLRPAQAELKVVKNTLLRLAAQAAGKPDLMRLVEGPTALAFTYGDMLEAAKAVTEYARTAPGQFALRGALLDGQLLTADDLKDWIRLPPKPVLVAQIAGQLQSPMANLLALLASPLQELSLLLQSALGELPGLIEARARQLEAAAEGAAP